MGGIKSVTVMEGKENEFESLFKELAAKVRDCDNGCNYYDLYKSERPRTYLVMEQYKNKTILQQHQRSEYGKYYLPNLHWIMEKIEVGYFECSV